LSRITAMKDLRGQDPLRKNSSQNRTAISQSESRSIQNQLLLVNNDVFLACETSLDSRRKIETTFNYISKSINIKKKFKIIFVLISRTFLFELVKTRILFLAFSFPHSIFLGAQLNSFRDKRLKMVFLKNFVFKKSVLWNALFVGIYIRLPDAGPLLKPLGT